MHFLYSDTALLPTTTTPSAHLWLPSGVQIQNCQQPISMILVTNFNDFAFRKQLNGKLTVDRKAADCILTVCQGIPTVTAVRRQWAWAICHCAQTDGLRTALPYHHQSHDGGYEGSNEELAPKGEAYFAAACDNENYPMHVCIVCLLRAAAIPGVSS